MDREGLIETSIGDLREEDLPEVAAIELASSPTPWTEGLFFNELRRPRSLAKAARTEGRVIGYVFANWVLDEGNILSFAVHPEFRRKGVGSTLVKEILEALLAEGCAAVYLEVRASNIAAQRLYERMGFRTFGIRKGYYRSPDEDGLIMGCTLRHVRGE